MRPNRASRNTVALTGSAGSSASKDHRGVEHGPWLAEEPPPRPAQPQRQLGHEEHQASGFEVLGKVVVTAVDHSPRQQSRVRNDHASDHLLEPDHLTTPLWCVTHA